MRRLLVSPALVPAFAVCILVLLCLPALPGVMLKTSRIWKGYHTLLIRDGAFGQDRVRLAFQRVGPGVVSEETALVSYSDLEGGAFSTYAELPTRLDAGDPRFDPYMRGLRGYFRTSDRKADWRIAYIPARWTGAATFRMLSRELGFPSRGGWRLVEYDPLEKTLVLTWAAVFSVIATLLPRKAPRRRNGELPALAIACMLCWFPFLASGGIAELCFVAAVFPAWVRLASERGIVLSSAERGGHGGTGEALSTYTAALAIALAALLLLGGFSWFRLAGTLAGAACSLLLLAARAPLGQLARRWNRKRAFPSVAVAHRGIGSLRLPAAATFPFAAAPLLLAVIPFLRPPLLPVPSPVAGLRDFSWRSIAELSARRHSAAGTVLPDVSDAVTHSAYQQALVFGRPYGFPTASERVTVMEYIENPAAGTVVPRQRTVRSFDSAWLARLTHAFPSPSLEELLIAEERPVTVRHGRSRSTFIRDLLAAALCGLALLGWFARDAGLRPLIRGRFWRFTTPARKKHTR